MILCLLIYSINCKSFKGHLIIENLPDKIPIFAVLLITIAITDI